MVENKKTVGYWTKERCQEEALKYKTRYEFQKNSGSAYYSAQKNKLLDEICSHMIDIKKPNNYWTKEKCAEEALKYKTKSEFQKKSSGAYEATRRNIWLNEICQHM
jgi:hypothetical protein